MLSVVSRQMESLTQQKVEEIGSPDLTERGSDCALWLKASPERCYVYLYATYCDPITTCYTMTLYGVLLIELSCYLTAGIMAKIKKAEGEQREQSKDEEDL